MVKWLNFWGGITLDAEMLLVSFGGISSKK